MKLNSFEFAMMNNPVRAASQWWLESPVLIGPPGSLAGKRVLEVGCGRGAGIEILLALGATHVTGFDLDPKMAALAQKRVAKYGDHARVFIGDAEAIDAPNFSFDAVVDYGIIHHIPNWQQAVKEIARVLKPGGVFYFEDLLKGLVSAWLVRDLFEHPQATQFYGREFRAGLEAAGLRVQKWWQWGEWGIMGQASKQTTLEKINA
jgi:SAM-dependent methyltransferase